MNRVHRWLLVAAGTTALLGGTAATAYADPFHLPYSYCLTTAPGIALSQYTWTGTGRLVQQVFGGTPAGTYGLLNCRYEATKYEGSIAGVRTLGTHTWLNPNQRR